MRQEGTSSMFKLACLLENQSEIFNFGQLWGRSDAMDRVLLRTQCSLMHEWMEGFKALTPSKMQSFSGKVLKYLEFAKGSQFITMRQVWALIRAGICMPHSTCMYVYVC